MSKTRPGGGPMGREYEREYDWKPGPQPAFGPPKPGQKVVYRWPAVPMGNRIVVPPQPNSPYPGTVPAEGTSNFYYHDQSMPLFWVDPLVVGGAYLDPAYPPAQGVGERPVFRRAVWASPRFDLQPWLQASASLSPASYPIWRGGHLQVQFSINDERISQIEEDLSVYAVSFTSVINPTQLSPIDQPQNVGQEFFNGSSQAVLTFPCPSPVRYWQMRLVLDYREPASFVPPPRIRVQSVLS